MLNGALSRIAHLALELLQRRICIWLMIRLEPFARTSFARATYPYAPYETGATILL
jgi:hypothetical protein